MINYKNIVLLLFFIISFKSVFSQSKDTLKSSFLAAPIIYNSPETRFAFGAAGIYFLKKNNNNSFQRTSSARGMGVYTMNKQIIVDCGLAMFFKNEDYIFKILNTYIKYPDKFYGVGNRVTSNNFEFYTYHQAETYPRILKRIYKKYYLGFQYRYCNLIDVKYKDNGMFDNLNLIGKYGGLSSGFGALIDYDSRDNFFNSYRGSYMNISYMLYDNLFGSDFNYKIFTFDYRKYYAFYRLYVLAFQFYTNIDYGQTPFRELAQMGGDVLMRGLYKGMYRDKRYLASQVELRIPVWNRIGIATFAGIGEIGSKFSDFNYYNAILSGGIGIRIMAKPKERVNIRIDYAISKPTNGWYLTISEAF